MPGALRNFRSNRDKNRKEIEPTTFRKFPETGENRFRGETWIVTDGSVGMEAQGIAVAEAVGLPFTLKRVRVTGAMQALPARLQVYVPPERLLRSVASDTPLGPPWPRLLISIGRRSVPIALALKRLSGAYALHIQNPKVPARLFDLVAAPLHDDFTGANVITTFGAVHSVTPARLAEAAKRFAVAVAPLPHPRITVLLGGTSQAFRFAPPEAASFGAALARLARESGGSLLVTPSRRTAPESIAALAARHRARPPPRLGRDRRQPLSRLSRRGRRGGGDRGFGQHGHRSRRHRQAGLYSIAQRQLAALAPLPCLDAGARRDAAFRGQARTLVLCAHQRYGGRGECDPARPRH